MIFPEKYTCFGIPVTIRESTDLDDTSKHAYFTSASPHILFQSSMPAKFKEFVIAHEIIHSWFHFSGVSNIMEEKHEEMLCDSLAPLLTEYTKTIIKNQKEKE